MEIFVKDFSGATRPRILKFGTNIKYDRLYCVLKNQPHMAYQSLYLSICFLSNNLPILSAQHLYVLQSSNFVYTMRTTKCYTENKTIEGTEIYFYLLFLFFLFLSLTPL